MQIKEFLNSVCEQIKYKPIRESISEELKNHIEESKENYIKEGLEEKVAEEKAINQMGDAEEIGKRLNKIHRQKLDWKLVIIALILMCFGFLIAFTKTCNITTEDTQINYMQKYLIFLLIGLILGVVIYFMDYKKLLNFSNVIYIFACAIIILTIEFGSLVNGIPYIRIGKISISASVIAVPLFIISFVGFLNEEIKENKLNKILIDKGINLKLLKIVILSIIALCLLTLIPSMASAFILSLVYLILASAQIIISNKNRLKNLIKLWGIVVGVSLLMLIYVGGFSPHVLYRFQASFDPHSDYQGYGWLGINREIVINSANVIGEADDMSNALDLFDEGTNYAFISILAHYGWIVSIGMVVAVILLCIKLIINSIKIKERYGKFIVIGISSMFILQSLFNVLMNFNMWLESDFDIPFISYGGSNLIINIMCLALILSIYRKKDIILVQNNNNKQNLINNN